ncbi:spore maturation protein CgeD [Bacillus sp. es.036]|nr:spore maturation protein CgeD [Bacillus sp. es.036]
MSMVSLLFLLSRVKGGIDLSDLITVILTSYNKPDLVEKSIQSVINQTISNWELWLMDDHSNKETQNIIKTYLNDKRINFFNSNIKNEDRYKKTRYATLINKAISLSKGKYITYLTDDTTYRSNRLKVMAEYLNQNPSHHIVYGGQLLQYVDESFNIFYESESKAKEILSNASNKVDHCSVMHTREIAEKVYSTYESYWNDDPIFWHNADAEFWNRLTDFAPFYPVDGSFEVALKTPSSFQVLNKDVPDPLPNGVLVRGLSQDIYLIDNQKKRLINAKWFNYFKYQPSKIVQIPDPLLYKYETGKSVNMSDLPYQILMKEDGVEQYFLYQNNQKRKIPNREVLQFFSLNQMLAVELSPTFISSISSGSPLSSKINQLQFLPDGRLFSYKDELYLSQNNHLHNIDVNVALKLKFNIREAIKLNAEEFGSYQLGNSFIWTFKTY